uniref:Aspartic protease APA1 n=1 Tax=Evansstolkia leycettana TaxID=196907 RepID=A0A4Y5UUB5_9EURO|nr:aspartic protease APA1 [Evansstolkia leycettana]
MRFLISLALLLCLSYDALAVPAPSRPQRKGRSFKVDRIRRRVAHGPSALRKAYAKYGIVPTHFGLDLLDFEPIDPHQSSSTAVDDVAQPAETGAVSASAVQGGAEFVSPVTIGGQKVVMDFDTGSSDMWVISTNSPAAAQQGHTVFDPAKSTTFKTLDGATFNITYGDQSFANGIVGMDTVDIGGATVTNQAIGLPTQLSQTFIEDTASNGLVGLAFSNINTVRPQQQKTFFDNVAASLDEPVMTASLKADGTGVYEFGTIDQTKFQGNMVNVSVDPTNGFWQFQSAEFAVGNGALQQITTAPTAIADTGTTLMLSSPEVVMAYYSQVQGAVLANGVGGFIYPCNTQLPDLSVAVGGETLATIPGSLLTFSQVGVNTTTGQPVCFGGLQSNQGSSLQIYGDVFLKSMFVVFDKRGPSLGFASPA